MKLFSWILIVSLNLVLLCGCNTTTDNNIQNTQSMNPNPPASVSGQIAERVNRL